MVIDYLDGSLDDALLNTMEVDNIEDFHNN